MWLTQTDLPILNKKVHVINPCCVCKNCWWGIIAMWFVGKYFYQNCCCLSWLKVGEIVFSCQLCFSLLAALRACVHSRFSSQSPFPRPNSFLAPFLTWIFSWESSLLTKTYFLVTRAHAFSQVQPSSSHWMVLSMAPYSPFQTASKISTLGFAFFEPI